VGKLKEMRTTERFQRMDTDDNNLADDIATEEGCEQAFDFWSDEGVQVLTK
jgi:hypothetical protein